MNNASTLYALVVDDSKLDRYLAEKMLAGTELFSKIICLTLAKDALEFVREAQWSPNDRVMCFIDIHMPLMNGFEFMDEIMRLPQGKTSMYEFFLISSSISEDDINKANSYADTRHVAKPLTKISILSLIEEENPHV